MRKISELLKRGYPETAFTDGIFLLHLYLGL
jgi:hypothetical protein